MRLPLLLAWSCAVSLYVAACSSFTESEASPTADGGADAQTTADGAAPDDDGGARSFCGRSAGAVFCDDFEQPQRSATVAAPWARITGPSANAL